MVDSRGGTLVGDASVRDVPTAVDCYLLQELFKNVDGNLRLSTYLYKPRDGKLTFGPVWDFDIAMGNVNYLGADQTTGWHIRNALWFRRMFEDPAFAARVTARWPILTTWVWSNRAVFGSYDGELLALRDWLSIRVAWMDAQLAP